MALTMKRTRIHDGDPPAADDYIVMDGQQKVGRTYRNMGTAVESWLWVVWTGNVQLPDCVGQAESLDAAKAKIKAAWERHK